MPVYPTCSKKTLRNILEPGTPGKQYLVSSLVIGETAGFFRSEAIDLS